MDELLEKSLPADQTLSSSDEENAGSPGSLTSTVIDNDEANALKEQCLAGPDFPDQESDSDEGEPGELQEGKGPEDRAELEESNGESE